MFSCNQIYTIDGTKADILGDNLVTVRQKWAV